MLEISALASDCRDVATYVLLSDEPCVVASTLSRKCNERVAKVAVLGICLDHSPEVARDLSQAGQFPSSRSRDDGTANLLEFLDLVATVEEEPQNLIGGHP